MRKKRSLQPRTRESVENRQLDADADSGRSLTPRGDISINPNVSNVRLDKLRCYKKGKSVIRILNMLDPEDPGNALLNGRLSAYDLAGLGGMSISEPALCVQYAGVHKDSGNYLKDPADARQCSYIIARSKSSSYEGINFWDLPYPKLYVMAKKARDSGEFGHGGSWDPKWNALMSGQMPALGAFKQRYFVVCHVLENGPNLDLTREHIEYRKDGKDVSEDYPRNGIALGDAPTDPLIVLQLPVSAGRKILQLCCMEKEDWEGDEAVDPSVMFRYGDPCGKFHQKSNTVKGGVFFTIYNPEKVKIKHHTTFKGITNPQVVEYEAAVSSKYKGPQGDISASLNSEQVDNIFNKHLFLWKDSQEDPADSYLLHEPSIEQRCELLAEAFGRHVPKLLEFCWMSQPEYTQFDSVKAILKNRTSVPVVKPDLEDDEDDDDDDAPFDQAEAEETLIAAKKSVSALADDFDDDDELDEDDLEDDDDDFDDDELDEDDLEDDDEFEDDEDEAEEAAAGEVLEDQYEAEDDDDDDDDDEEAEASSDFDEFDDEADNSELEEQLNQSLSKAKALSRSRKRTSKKPTKAAPAATKKVTKKKTTKKKTTKKKTTKKATKT